MPRIITIPSLLCICYLLTSCVANIDPTLPKSRLQEITFAAQVNLAASPSHPSGYLPVEPISPGTKVDLIAADSNLAWLLVEYQDKLGWAPAFFSQIGTGRVDPPIVMTPLDGTCTQYVGTTLEPEEHWISSAAGSVIVEGSVFRPHVQKSFAQATLQAQITGAGQIVGSDYLHLQLTSSSNVVLFAFAVQNVTQGSTINFLLEDAGAEPLSFQATFFTDGCGEDRSSSGNTDVNILPIGQLKTTLPTPPPPPQPTNLPAPTPGKTSVATPGKTPLSTPASTPTKIVVRSGERLTSPTRGEIQALADLWDEIHHEVDNTLNPSRLPEVLTGGALRQQEQTLQNLKAGSCYWEFTDLSPSQITGWQEISVNEVIVTMDKHWDGRLYCRGVLDRKSSFNDPFSVRYQIIRTNQGWRIAEKVPLDSAVTIALPPPRVQTPPTPTPPITDNTADQLYTHLVAKSRASRISVAYAREAELFASTLVYRLNEFQLPREGITQQTMNNLLYQADIADRLNGLIQEVWGDWLGIASRQKLDPYRASPVNRGLSTYRVLVIRMVQGSNGRLTAAEQRALYNYFSRWEDPSVWNTNVKGVIAAINRENFQ